MLFNTFEYIIFFVIAVTIYYVIPHKARTYWLLAASYYFYGFWNVKYVFLMLTVTLISYLAGYMICKGHKTGLIIGVFSLISLLVYFKYFNFIINNLNNFLKLFGNDYNGIQSISIVLPVGISFYVFQAISYIIDVYRDHTCMEKNIFRYALYISFFPQLVAGPIERSDKILNQLCDIEGGKKRFNYDGFVDGIQLIVYGLFLKMVIADRLSILVDRVYAEYYKLPSAALIVGMIGFSIQIYCDFAGYSWIACGSAKVIGVDLIDNFRAPYFSQTVSDFWRRWHISLSTWFRDYVYIPLGGNRCSKLRNSFNIMLTMLLSGLWHGAAWHYVAWGGIHGLAQVAEKSIYNIRSRDKKDTFFIRMTKTSVVGLFVSVAWIFFRANSFMEAVLYLKRIFCEWDVTCFFSGEIYNLGLNVIECNILCVALIIMVIVDNFNYKYCLKEFELVNSQGIVFKWLFNMVLIVFIVVFGVYGGTGTDPSFIYFQF